MDDNKDVQELDDSSTDVDMDADEISLDDVSAEAEEESTDDSKDDSKTDDEVEDDSTEEPEEAATSDEETDEPDDTEEQEESEQSDQPSEEEQRKQYNAEMAQRRIAEKRQREQQIATSQQQYLEESADLQELALRQLQVDAYTNRIETNTNKLSNAYEKALKDSEILSSSDPVIKKAVDKALDNFQAQHVQIDQYGNPIQVGDDLYTYLMNEAEHIAELRGIGAKDQVRNKAKQSASTLPTPRRAPKQSKVDPDIAGFDEEAGFKR